jgi:hypothetical protein
MTAVCTTSTSLSQGSFGHPSSTDTAATSSSCLTSCVAVVAVVVLLLLPPFQQEAGIVRFVRGQIVAAICTCGGCVRYCAPPTTHWLGTIEMHQTFASTTTNLPPLPPTTTSLFFIVSTYRWIIAYCMWRINNSTTRTTQQSVTFVNQDKRRLTLSSFPSVPSNADESTTTTRATAIALEEEGWTRNTTTTSR